MSGFIEIGDIEPKIQFTSSAGQTLFSYPFIAFSDSDLTVYVNDVVSVDYTVTNLYPDEGGSITFNTGLSGGDIVTILRDTPFEKTTGWVTGGDFKATTLDNQNAKFIAMVQQNERDIDSAVKLSPTAPSGIDILFPTPEDGLFPVWDGDDGKMVNSSESADNIIDATKVYRDEAEGFADDAEYSADLAETYKDIAVAAADSVVSIPQIWLSGDGSTVAFNISAEGATSDNAEAYDVTVDGVKVKPTNDYTVTSDAGVITLTFVGGTIPEDRVENIIILARGSTLIEVPVGETPFIEVTGTGDDKGLIVTEQFSVGKPSTPKESVFGGGDSYPVGREDLTSEEPTKQGSAWHCDIANTTGLVITSATDITDILASDSSSTTGLFDGTTAGKYILVGSDNTFGGVKAKIDTLGTVESTNIIQEYLADSSTWTTVPFMVTDSDYPYTQKGNQIATCSSCSEQWRSGFDPLNLPVAWEKVTLNINGTDYTKYWARFRVITAITSDPIMEQIKLHTNRFEINADGNTEYFGRGRYANTISVSQIANDLFDPGDRDIKIAPGITVKAKDNRFEYEKKDGFILTGVLPEGFDSSVPLQIIVDWYVEGALTGDVSFEAEATAVTPGFKYDGNANTQVLTTNITTISNEEEDAQRSIILLSAFNGLPGYRIYIAFSRDATIGNATGDTYADDVIITGTQLKGYFWKP